MKNFITLVFLSCIAAACPAQNWAGEVFGKALERPHAKSKNETFKGQILKKERSGMGLMVTKDGSLFVGDLSKGNFHGYGMLMAPEGGKIAKCNGCAVYVGNWKQGVKSGKGICYDADGNIIYNGLFENDSPTGDYPSSGISPDDYFALVEYDDGDKYAGEFRDGTFNGYGAYIWADGDTWFGSFIDGERSGVGLYLMYDGEWATVKCTGYMQETLTSSVAYNNIEASLKAARAENRALIIGSFANAASAGLQVAGGIQNMRSGGSNYSSEDFEAGSGAGRSSGGQGKTAAGAESQGRNCGDAWRTDSRTYSNYESELIRMRTSPEKYNNYTSNYMGIQEKMKRIREKWEARGCKITRSPHE